MATRAGTYSNDLHLYPLYLKWSAESFRNGNISDGTSFFNAVCCSPRKLERELEYKVYKQIWKLKGRPKGDGEFGRKSFQGTTGGFSSTALEKAQALENAIRKVDQNELSMRENQVHKCLWIIHGQPAGDEEYGKHAFYSTHGRSSSIMDKLSAARMYADQSRALTWLTNNAEVRLIKRADGQLERLAIDSGLGQYGSQIIDIGRQSLENAISVLSNCIATVNGGNVVFTMLQPYSRWPGAVFLPRENREVNILIKDNIPVWRLFDRTTRTISWMYAHDGDGLDQAMGHIWSLIYGGESVCVQDFTIALQVTQINRIVFASIGFASARSRLDTAKVVDAANWAITLLVGGRFRSDNPKSFAGHALLAIEGVKNGRQFLHYAHLTANSHSCAHPTVEIIDAAEVGELSVRCQSATWMRKRRFAKLMVNNIEREVGTIMPFSFTNESLALSGLKKVFNFFTGGEVPSFDDNCLVWAIRKLWSTGIVAPMWNFFPVPIDYVRTIATQPELVQFTPGFDS